MIHGITRIGFNHKRKTNETNIVKAIKEIFSMAYKQRD